jgi:hypothetical protein
MDSTGNDPFTRTQSLLVRLACQDEMPQWRTLMSQYHYLGFKPIVGGALHDVAQ